MPTNKPEQEWIEAVGESVAEMNAEVDKYKTKGFEPSGPMMVEESFLQGGSVYKQKMLKNTGLPLEELEAFILTVGKDQYKGKPLSEVPLKELDWLAGQYWVEAQTKCHITAYLAHPTIARELEKELNK